MVPVRGSGLGVRRFPAAVRCLLLGIRRSRFPNPEPRIPNPEPRYHLAMLNYIWFGLMAIALVVAAFNGTRRSGDDRRRGFRVHGGSDRDWPGRHHDAVARA